MNEDKIVKQYRYKKGEVLFAPAGMVFFSILLFFEYLIYFDTRFVSYKMTKGDIYSGYLYTSVCISGIVYFMFVWLKRFSLRVITDPETITLSTWYKKQQLKWTEINRIDYHNGSPWYRLVLYRENDKLLTVSGELSNFTELLSIIKRNIQYNPTEFYYSIRKKIAFLINVIFGIIIFISIFLVAGKEVTLPIGIQSLILIGGSIVVIYSNIQWSSDLLVANDNGLSLIRLGKRIDIQWEEITNKSQISYFVTEPSWRALAIGKWKATIKSNEKIVSFCSDLDSVNELLTNIFEKTGINFFNT